MKETIDTKIENPPQGNIPAQELTPSSKPNSARLGDVNILEVSEVDISAMELPRIDTLPMTLGSQRPIQGYKPLGDLALLKEYNDSEFTISAYPVASDQDQMSTSLMVKGTNIINPMSIPPVGASDAVTEAALSAAMFGSNGPSISTPGSAKRAAVEQAASTMKSVIVKAFNRSIPFTDYGPAQRTLLLSCYEAETLKIQHFWQAVDNIRGYAEYLSEMGVPLDDSWLPLYDPDVYTALVAVYDACQDLLLYDDMSHKRLEKLCKIYTASKRNSYPGTCMMQDCVIAEHMFAGTVTAADNANISLDITHPVPNYTTVQWMSVLLTSKATAVAAVQALAASIKGVRVGYEPVITALAQLVSKGALAEKHLRDYLPAEPSGSGFIRFADSRPAFSFAFHERFEYAPETVYGEVGGSNTLATWTIHQLPDYASTVAPSQCLSRRPVGKCHGSEAFTIAEVVDIGLFKDADQSGYLGKLGGRVWGTPGTQSAFTSPAAGTNHATIFVDAVYGDFYVDGILAASVTQFQGQRSLLHGMSYYATGSGIHNVLSAFKPFSATVASAGLPGINVDVGEGIGLLQSVVTPGLSNTHDTADIAGADRFLMRLMEDLELSIFVLPATNPGGVRCTPKSLARGYALTGYYTYSLAAVDNAVGMAYLDMVPQMQINFARK